MTEFGGIKSIRRGPARRRNAPAYLSKGWLAAIAAIGFTAMSSGGAFAQGSMKDGACDPYKDYKCLDSYLGDGVLERFFNYYKLEWGKGSAPTDPNAPSASREGWPRTPATVPPLAYTEWPSGAWTPIGVTRPNSVDSPLMNAIANTDVGKWMNENHLQTYGWVEAGANLSTNQAGKGRNAPVAYTYIANSGQLDQAVIYLERLPDTVQTDHIDWGFRLSGIYGADYRYTNSYGVASYQFNKRNNENGYDFPMEYIDIYIPQVLQGLNIRAGRYISIPDIEAQLAPNNITYTHSLTYSWDNYTNTGVVASLQVTKNLLFQIGVDDGTETPLWHIGQKIKNLDPNNALYPGTSFKKDPGNQPSLAACVQYKWNNGWDALYPCIDGINDGQWGYNNIQWHGLTYYHRFNPEWHIDFEAYYLDEKGVPNSRNATAMSIFQAGGTPFSPQYVPFNGPTPLYCSNATDLKCTVWAVGVLTYLNYTPDPLNNFTLRLEWYDDPNGWRTSTGGPTKYFDTNFSWQHWFSPQIEIRPEIGYWHSFGTAAFNGNPTLGIPGNKKEMVEVSTDLIVHF
jgi:Putative beta-barrel porin-2, OmpL-like. bbp2